MQITNLDTLMNNFTWIHKKIVGPDLSWPHPIYREGAHHMWYPHYFVHLHNRTHTGR